MNARGTLGEHKRISVQWTIFLLRFAENAGIMLADSMQNAALLIRHLLVGRPRAGTRHGRSREREARPFVVLPPHDSSGRTSTGPEGGISRAWLAFRKERIFVS
jgi:hypothetical protein